MFAALRTGQGRRPRRVLEECASYRVEIVTQVGASYPAVLVDDPFPPAVLFVRGRLDVLAARGRDRRHLARPLPVGRRRSNLVKRWRPTVWPSSPAWRAASTAPPTACGRPEGCGRRRRQRSRSPVPEAERRHLAVGRRQRAARVRGGLLARRPTTSTSRCGTASSPPRRGARRRRIARQRREPDHGQGRVRSRRHRDGVPVSARNPGARDNKLLVECAPPVTYVALGLDHSRDLGRAARRPRRCGVRGVFDLCIDLTRST